MSDLVRRVEDSPVSFKTGRALTRLTSETQMAQAHIRASVRVEQAQIQAVSMVGEFAVSEASYLKAVQRRAEHANVDAADAIAMIVDQTVLSIARRVARFGQGVES